MKQPVDPLSAAVEAAVERALERRLPELLNKHLPSPAPAVSSKPSHEIDGERFVTLREACQRLGAHRTTLLRWEQHGLVPPRRRLPGQRTGWLATELEAILTNLKRTKGAA